MIHDDGPGFDLSTADAGEGMQIMSDRIAALQGELTVESLPGRGTTVTGRLPEMAHAGASCMSARSARFLSRAVVGAIIAMLVIQIVLVLVGGDRLVTREIISVGDPNAQGMANVRHDLEQILATGGTLGSSNPVSGVLFAVVALIWGVTGSVIVSRQPHNAAGWLFCIAAGAVALNGFAYTYTVYGVKIAGSPLPVQDLVALLGDYSFVVAALIPLLVLLFPDGRPPSPRWRWADWVLLAGIGDRNRFVRAHPRPAQQLRRVRDPLREPVRGLGLRRRAPC